MKRLPGANLYVKVENEAGHRIQELFLQGQPIQRNQQYTAAFVTAQGVSQKYGTNRRNLDVHAIEALERYLAGKSPVEANLRGTVIAV